MRLGRTVGAESSVIVLALRGDLTHATAEAEQRRLSIHVGTGHLIIDSSSRSGSTPDGISADEISLPGCTRMATARRLQFALLAMVPGKGASEP